MRATWRREPLRAGWGLGDAALSSLTNFAVAILVARTIGLEGFGIFAIAVATYSLLLAVTRALTSEPLTLRFSATAPAKWKAGTAAATGFAIVVGVIAGGGVAAVGVAFGGALGRGLLALAVVLPGLLVQDVWRYAFFAGRRGGAAFLNDLAWALALGPSLAALLVLGVTEVSAFVLVWGAAGALAGFVGAFQARLVPRPGRAVEWWRRNRDVGAAYAADYALVGAAAHTSPFITGGLAGLTAVGALRAAQNLLGPLQVIRTGASLVAVPAGVVEVRKPDARLGEAAARLSGAMMAVSLGYGLVILLLPRAAGTALLGQAWDAAHAVVLPLVVAGVARACILGPSVGLRALGAARRSLRISVVSAPLHLGAVAVGASLGGARGAAIGVAVAAGAAVPLFWWQFFVALHAGPPLTWRRGFVRLRPISAREADGAAGRAVGDY